MSPFFKLAVTQLSPSKVYLNWRVNWIMNHALLKSEMADHERATQGRIRRPNRASRTPRLRANHQSLARNWQETSRRVSLCVCVGLLWHGVYLFDWLITKNIFVDLWPLDESALVAGWCTHVPVRRCRQTRGNVARRAPTQSRFHYKRCPARGGTISWCAQCSRLLSW